MMMSNNVFFTLVMLDIDFFTSKREILFKTFLTFKQKKKKRVRFHSGVLYFILSYSVRSYLHVNFQIEDNRDIKYAF